MRRVEVCHFCLTKNPKSPWHQGIDVATATLQLMRHLFNDRILIIMVYEIISTYLGSMSSPTHSLSTTKRGPLMWVGANHLVPWWRPELLAKSWQKTTAGWHAGSDFQVEKEASQSAAMHQHLCVQFVYQTLEYPYPFLWNFSLLISRFIGNLSQKFKKKTTFWVTI